MVDDEGANRGQLGEGVRPGLRREGSGEVFEHVVAGVMAERHQERDDERLAVRVVGQTSGESVRRVHEDVAAATVAQRALDPGERRLALRAAMARERDDATGPFRQRLVEGGGCRGEVPFAREQRRRNPKLLEAGGRGTDCRRGCALEPSVDDVRRHHEDAAGTAAPQAGKHV